MTFLVRFLPDGEPLEVSGPIRVRDAAARAGTWIDEPCGGNGSCTGCRVRFEKGAPPPRAVERELLFRAEIDAGWRLGCQAVIEGSATIEVPPAPLDAATKSFGAEVLPGHHDPRAVGQAIAVDLGSTTIAAALVDRASTRVLRAVSVPNLQTRLAEDVIARVARAQDEGAEPLEDALIDSLRTALTELGPADEDTVLACGNPIVTHFLLGADTRGLGHAPFEPAFTDPVERQIDALGGRVVRTFPLVAGHVGGDAVAAALACGLDRCTGPEALIDVGTNCEIVLAAPDGLRATSAAAGPAFEGGGIRQGMRAAPGAIDRVLVGQDGELAVRVRGDADPIGLCGTGLVDATAALVELGVVDATGRLRGRDEVDDVWRDSIEDGTHGEHAFLLAQRPAGEVRLHALDVRALQLAKAAVAAGLDVLLEDAGIRIEDLERVHLCGSFGARLPIASLRRIGLLDRVPPPRIRFAGDAAAIGARLGLCSPDAWERALRIAAGTRHVDPTLDTDYPERFARAMAFPDIGSSHVRPS